MLRFPARVDSTIKWIQGPSVLDIGCTGHVLDTSSPHWLHGRLRKEFPLVIGIDTSAENVALLRKDGYEHVFLQSAESFQLDQQFDTIVAGELIEHLSNPGLFLTRSRDHLKPGGRIVLTTPNPFSLLFVSYALLKYPKTCENLQHTCWFCPQTIKELVERCGLKIDHFELFDDYPAGSSSWRFRLFVLLRSSVGFLLPNVLAKNRMLLVLSAAEDAALRVQCSSDPGV